MPRGMYKSRSLRRVFVKTPGGKTVLHYKERKPKQARCAICKAKLHGVPRLRPFKMKKMAKTKKRPTRPYPNLCSKCMRKKIKESIK